MNAIQAIAPIPKADGIALAGFGRRDDPYVIPPCPNEVAILTVLRSLKRDEGGRGLSYLLTEWGLADDIGPSIHRVRFLRRQFTETEIHTDRMASYVDFSNVENALVPDSSPIVWSFGPQIALPLDLGWLHYDGLAQNSRPAEPLDVSLFYSCPLGKASIYVYGSCAPGDSEAVATEAQSVFAAAVCYHRDVQTPWPFDKSGPLYGRFFLAERLIGYAGVGAMAGKLIKVRLTFEDVDPKHREMVGDCTKAIRYAIEGRATSWGRDCPSS